MTDIPQAPSSGSVGRRPSEFTRVATLSADKHAVEDVHFRSRWRLNDWILGTGAGQIVGLFCIFVLLFFACALCWILVGGSEEEVADASFEQSLWISWGLFFDPGTQTGVPASDPQQVKVVAVVFSIFGFIFNLAVLGLVVDYIRRVLDNWKKVRSRVVENGHVLILGWGDKTLFLLCELLSAQCKEHKHQQIVILANRSVFEMKQDVRIHLLAYPELKSRRTNIKYREGDPSDVVELVKVSAQAASDILILGKRSNSDQENVQTLLALSALPPPEANKQCGFSGDVFVEMRKFESVSVVTDLLPIAHGIVARHAVNRMLILRAMVKNVGFCYLDIVSFKKFGDEEGNELYFRPVAKQLVGVPFVDACLAFPKAVVCGLRPRNELECGLDLLPERSRLLKEGDNLIMLARELEDCLAGRSDEKVLNTYTGSRASTAAIGSSTPAWPKLAVDMAPQLSDGTQVKLGPSSDGPKTVIIIGCPGDIAHFLEMLDEYLALGSTVHLLSDKRQSWRHRKLRALRSAETTMLADGSLQLLPVGGFKSCGQCGTPFPEEGKFCCECGTKREDCSCLEHTTLIHHYGSTICRRTLALLPLNVADNIIVLSESIIEDEAPLEIDSRSLTTIVHLQAISKELNCRKLGIRKSCKTVVELLDPKSEHVVKDNANIRRHGSFFYSNGVETAVFAMAAGDKYMYNVLMRLLTPGSGAGEIAAVSIGCLVRGEEELSFFDIHARISEACGGVLLGWRREGDKTSFYPQLNPANKLKPLTWRQDGKDEILIIRPARVNCISSDEPSRNDSGASHGDHRAQSQKDT